MDPYYYEGFHDENGIENLEEIFDFARNNKNVTLLLGNHKLFKFLFGNHKIWKS